MRASPTPTYRGRAARILAAPRLCAELAAIDDLDVLVLVSKQRTKFLNPLEGSIFREEPHQHWDRGHGLKPDDPCVISLGDLECAGLRRRVEPAPPGAWQRVRRRRPWQASWGCQRRCSWRFTGIPTRTPKLGLPAPSFAQRRSLGSRGEETGKCPQRS